MTLKVTCNLYLCYYSGKSFYYYLTRRGNGLLTLYYNDIIQKYLNKTPKFTNFNFIYLYIHICPKCKYSKINKHTFFDKITKIKQDTEGNKNLSYFSLMKESFKYLIIKGVWVMVLTPLSTIFRVYRGTQFYWWRKPEYLVKTTDLPQV